MNSSHEQSWFTTQLKKSADPIRAVNEKRYLKSPFSHYGVRVPVLRKLAKTWLRNHKNLSFSDLLSFTEKLWAGDYHEERMLAIFLLVYRVDELTFHDLLRIEHMVKTAIGWAELDMIAAWLCGQLYYDNTPKMTSVMKRWIKDENFWVQRAALLTLLGPVRKDPKHFPLFVELSVPLLSEKEFFIRKAIGWVLRELAKINPQLVYAYVSKYKAQMSGLTYREATRKLPPKLQRELSLVH
ncbi:MAG: DNA alkylation repair protein [bacterium]